MFVEITPERPTVELERSSERERSLDETRDAAATFGHVVVDAALDRDLDHAQKLLIHLDFRYP